MLTEILVLLFMMNPISTIPIILAETSHINVARKRFVVIREMFITLTILILFATFGPGFLSSIGITFSAVRIGGSVLLFKAAFGLLYSDISDRKESETEPLVVPISIPIIVGPAVMSFTVSLKSQIESMVHVYYIILIAWFVNSLICVSATILGGKFNKTANIVLSKVGGTLITFIAAQMLITGFREIMQL